MASVETPATPQCESRSYKTTVMFANERPKTLRHRSRFDSTTSSGPIEVPKVSASPSNLFSSCSRTRPTTVSMSTPASTVKNLDMTDDSGYEGLTPSNTPKAKAVRILDKAAEFVSSDIGSPIMAVRRRWKRYNVSLYTHPRPKSTQELLPIFVALIVIGSATFAVFALSSALGRAGARSNGKYESLRYAHSKQSATSRSKRSVAHDDLSISPANDIVAAYEEMMIKQAKRDRLLKKIHSFHHFGSSRVEPLDLQQPQNRPRIAKNKTRSKRAPMSMKPDPLDEFRFRSSPVEEFRYTNE